MEKTITLRNTEITFSIWDLGGQREFLSMLPLVSWSFIVHSPEIFLVRFYGPYMFHFRKENCGAFYLLYTVWVDDCMLIAFGTCFETGRMYFRHYSMLCSRSLRADLVLRGLNL